VIANGDCGAVPERPTDWGDVPALLVTVSVADAVPADAGVKTMLITQDPPAATVVPQVLVCAKLAASAPPIAMAMPVRSAFPEFPRVIACPLDEVPTACDAKVSDGGERVAMGEGGGPVMVKVRRALMPPCPGLATLTWAVPATAMSDA
jgi:hypothetical protein